MTNQPEALRLARDLADWWDGCENHHAAAPHRCAITLLRQQHAEIERLRAEVGRLEAELLTKQRGQYVDGLFGRGGRS